MDVSRVFHMNGGDGKTSYAKNSSMQNTIQSQTKKTKQSASLEFYRKFFPDTVRIADLGCSSGPNPLVGFADIVEAIRNECSLIGRPFPDFMLLLNDLPSNDFNSIFSLLPDFNNKWGFNQGNNSGRCYVSGVPGSFHGRLFPSGSLDIVHSSMSLHWLSQVPKLEDGSNRLLNKGNVYISKTSEVGVREAYLMQFERDFSLFLMSRSEEMVEGGRMILSFSGRKGDHALIENCYPSELLAEALRDMASVGLVDSKDIDTWNGPFYAASLEEIRSIITKVGCFDIEILENFETSLTTAQQDDELAPTNNEEKILSLAEFTTRTMRAVNEPMLGSHFGEDKMEELFKRYQRKYELYYSTNRAVVINIFVYLVKKS